MVGSAAYTCHRVQAYRTAHSDDGHAAAAEWIRQHTGTDDFVIYVLDTQTQDWNPAYLYWARRQGYNLIAAEVSLARLREISRRFAGKTGLSIYFPDSLEPLAQELGRDSDALAIATRAPHGSLYHFE